ncbi:ABC-type sugar transport system ATPase subunit [Rubellimicrobium aerolatum]|nr:ABC-type sugar transport system ATPase subunit [Rubellimicrobium aerolatum]
MTATQNIHLAPKIAGRNRAEIDGEARRAAEILSATPIGSNASQGERVAMGRAVGRGSQGRPLRRAPLDLAARFRVQSRHRGGGRGAP